MNGDISDLHHFIKDACQQLFLLEHKKDNDGTVKVNGFEFDRSDDESEVDGQVQNRFFDESLLQHIMIKRNEKFHCAECKFETTSYKDFHTHCINDHQEYDNAKVAGDERTSVYRCIKCFFLSLSFSGFKIHCFKIHKCLPHDVLQSVSWSNPNAEFYFQQFTQVAEGSRQKKHALKLLKYYFSNKQKRSGFVTEKPEVTDHDPLSSISAEELSCLLCDFKCQCVYFLEKHYHSHHDANGPERSPSDNLFHCALCIFNTASYKKLHLHHKAFHKESIEDFLDKVPQQKSSDVYMPDSLDKVPQQKSSDVYMPDSPPPSLDQQSANDTPRLLQCHVCKFSTTNVCVLLNHWRSSHPRDYPPFVAQAAEDDFRENTLEVNLPLGMVQKNWINGWMNEDCTSLYKEPQYHCIHCTFDCLQKDAMRRHYLTFHPNKLCSNGTMVVTESPSVQKMDPSAPRLCQKSTMLQCSRCSEFTTCFYKEMLMHYKSQHEAIVKELSKGDLDNEIKNSVVTRCFKCLDFYCSDALVLLEHYICDHAINLPTFSLLNADSEIFSAACQFCKQTFDNLKLLCEHLENHRKEQLKIFKQQHVSAYCCSKCRRVFRHHKTIHGHYTRVHFKWNESHFTYDDFPTEFFSNKPIASVIAQKQNDSLVSQAVVEPVMPPPNHFLEKKPSDDLSDKISDQQSLCSSLPSESSSASFACSCYVCGLDFHTISGLQRHLKRNHDIQANTSTIKSKLAEAPKRKLYRTCSHRTYKNKNLNVYKTHLASCHNESNPHNCPHCDKSYVCEVVLRMHVRKKHKFSNFKKVNVAPRILNRSCTFKRFLMDEKPELYERHVAQKHNEATPFHCPKCDRAYICKSCFLTHLHKTHKLQLDERRLQKCQQSLSSECSKPIVKPSYSRRIPAVRNSSSDSQSKDYRHSKSVKTSKGQWKCLFCRKVAESYVGLRRHCIKDHSSHRMMRCRWCDYICRTNVQLSNHLKIHSKFVAQRMKILREICRKNRQNALLQDGKHSRPRCPPARPPNDDETMEVDLPTPGSPQTVPIVPIGTAKKSIRPGFFCRKTIPKSRPNYSKSSATPRHYIVTERGTYRCRLCSFVSAEKNRLMWHLKSVHINAKLYKCKLCSFEHKVFDQMQAHLTVHHKMERNHQLAIEVSVQYGGDIKEAEVTVDEPYIPSNSLPIMEIATEQNAPELVDVETADSGQEREEPISPGTLGSRPIEVMEDSSFRCSYCSACLTSSYEAEYHMIRHERCMVNTTEIDESALTFAKFTSFLQPL